ncbi:MAG: MFS transporter [Bacteroidales bacterium]|nr:MFS transporter [Bacteroidales bacterium]
MNVYKTAKEDRVPWGQKAAYGAGQLTINLYPAALGVFMFYLIYGFKMDPALAGLVAALPKIFDALIDPVMGFITDNTRSRWGRRKPYILVGSMLTGIAFMVLWQLYPENSQSYNFIYFLSLSFVFFISFTIYSTPFIGLGYEMTPDYNERTRLMAAGQFLGQMAWMIAPWFWILIGNPELFFEESTEGVRVLSFWVGGFSIILGAFPALFCKEMVLPNAEDESKLSLKNMASNLKELWKAVVQTLTCKPFVKLCGSTFLIFNGFQTIAQFSYFIILYYLFEGSITAAGTWPPWFSTVNAGATAFLIIPIVTKISTKIGKKNAFIVSTWLSIIGYVLKWWCFNPSNPWLMFIPLPFISFGIGGLFTLMMSMTADVCDLDELNNGKRREGMFGAVYWLMVKIGNGLAFALSGVVLKMVGFNENASVQSAEALVNLRLADIIIPIVFALMAIVIMWKYSLTEEKAHDIRETLIARRGKVKHQGE